MGLLNNGTTRVHVDFIHAHGESWEVEGYIKTSDPAFTLNQFSLVADKEKYTAQAQSRIVKDEPSALPFTATLSIDRNKPQTISAVIEGESKPHNSKIETGPFTRLSNLSFAYAVYGTVIIRRLMGGKLKIYPTTPKGIVVAEARYLLRLLFNWRLGDALNYLSKRRDTQAASTKARILEVIKPFLFVVEAVVYIPRAFLLRILRHLGMRYKKRPIWLISDRGMAAGDNGEALFRYIANVNDVPADVFFVISKKSKDYRRMAQYGKVINQGSISHKLKFLLADKVISSHADIEVTNPFFRQRDHFIDLFQFDFVFLQHGVTSNDVSGWLNRFEKNIKLFVTVGKKEYDAILQPAFSYTEKEVALTGFPRYDLLENEPEGKVIIVPTYRATLLKTKTDKHGARPYDPTFKQTEYFKFYNRLIQDRRFNDALRERAMTAEFYIHPNFVAQMSDFQSTELVSLPEYPYDYKTAFKSGSLLVTDYSSVAFDFAYLKKPVVYTRFDEEEFFASHSYEKGTFFSPEKDGFGELTYTYDELVKAIVNQIENDCKMAKRYQERVDKFFYKNDKNNSKRVYQAILSMEKRA